MYLGIDLGTTSIKLVLTNETGDIVESVSRHYDLDRPHPLWSEQKPEDWWTGFCQAMDSLTSKQPLQLVKAIGLSGQMHGAVLLDKEQKVIRPAILWNDGRSEVQCKELEQQVPETRQITGNITMPGFTAPKVLWVKQHEPEHFKHIAKVLLPKDYLRLLLTGDFATDMSDAAGTMWLDVKKRSWHPKLLAACGLSEKHMPELYEGSHMTGTLSSALAKRWNIPEVPVVAGAGDNAAGAIGVGIVKPGQAMLSLGTSGVYFAVTDSFKANPNLAVHSFCHALPNIWHLMSVLLSAASCLQWFSESIAHKPVTELLAALDQADIDPLNAPIFLPYLSGERTPHNNPRATGCFFGLTHSTDQITLTHSVLEGVSFAFADAVDALHQAGGKPTEITLIGGGAKSLYWRQLLADVLNSPVTCRKGGEVGPSLGAAKLAQIAVNPATKIEHICQQPKLEAVFEPNDANVAKYAQKRIKFQQLYRQLSPLF